MRALPLLLVLSFACRDQIDADPPKAVDTVDTVPLDTDTVTDADGDGVPAEEDCDDENAAVFPGAAERCNGLDDDCDGTIDVDPIDGTEFFADADADGFGDDSTRTTTCEAPADHVAVGGDCNDADAAIHPEADEICNELDDDCDGEVDIDPIDPTTSWADADGDGFGDLATPLAACDVPAGYVVDATDCDDTNAEVRPSAIEICNGLDDNCDGLVDDPTASDVSTWYADADGDGFGDSVQPTSTCTAPAGFVADATDCDDTQDDTFPGATETCNGIDDDCDTLVDEEANDATAFHTDLDADGYGDASTAVSACEAPTGTVADATDCDDTIGSVYPGAPELCDSLDNDCNGLVDDDAGLEGTWYRDSDDDGFGDSATTQLSCSQPAGFVAASGDCADTDATAFPGAEERCDDTDRNCDGDPTAGAVDASTWWLDVDGDGYGGTLASLDACTQPTDYAATSDDCDDTLADAYPGAEERCDGNDNDCNGLVDDDPSDPATWYADTDSDGFGDATSSLVACDGPADHVADATDCDDTTSTARPGGTEVCDDVDNDCDGRTDIDALDADPWYPDSDGDGFGDPEAVLLACTPPDDHVANDEDCNDLLATVRPDAEEDCDPGSDLDCDGDPTAGATDTTTFWLDSDQDGFGSTAVQACEAGPGQVDMDGDCNDSVATIFPGADERCNNLDDDCDGTADNDPIDATDWYLDSDGDGWGDGDAVSACTAPADHVARAGDCDDTTTAAFPGATELCDDLDNDCDGTIDGDGLPGSNTWYADTDGDGHGDPGTSVQTCSAPPAHVALPDDCDDTEPLAWTGASEVCDSVDNDCDGTTDGPTAIDALTLFADADGDGYGVPGTPVRDCAVTDALSDNALDCDDSNIDVSPDALEICDGIDNDCNGAIDDAASPDEWTLDLDGDGYGEDGTEIASCTQPSPLYAPDGGDCDDDDAAINPGANDACDDLDANCDGLVGFDADGDGWSDATCGGLDCDDTDPSVSPDPGGGCAVGESCLDVLSRGRGDTSGPYVLDPDGYDQGLAPFETWCDMDAHGGGWTLVGSVANDGTRRWNSLAVFTDTSSFGQHADWEGVDYKNPGWTTMDALDLRVTTDTYEVGWTGLFLAESFGEFIAREYDAATCSTEFIGGAPDLFSANLTQDQIDMHDVLVRALDSNATCFPGSNENAIVSFTLSSCCWTNGLGNAPNGQAVWRTHDLSMLKLDNLVPEGCTAGSYPCNPRSLYHNASYNDYDTIPKAPYAGVWVR